MSLKNCLLLLLVIYSKFSIAQNFTSIFPKSDQFVSEKIKLSWNEFKSADQYKIVISTDSNFNSIVSDVNINNKFWTSPSLLSGKYFWKVIALKNGTSLDSISPNSFNVFNINELDSLNLWIRADTGIISSGGLVESWNDLSDSLLNLNQVTGARRPLLTDSVLNNYPGVFFDGVNDYFDFSIDLTNANYSFSTVYNTLTRSGLIRLFSGSNSWFFGPYSGKHSAFSGGFTQGKIVDSARFVVQSVHVKNDSLFNYVNDSLYGHKVATTRPGTSLRMGSFLSGYIAEVVIVNGLITDSTRAKIDSYLLDKYAPPVNLGADRRVCSFPDSIALGIDYALDYTWSTGDTTDAIQVDSAGKYYVTITDMFERTSVDSIWYVLDTTNYQVDFGYNDSTICLGDSLQLFAGSERFSYQWNTADTTNNIVVKTAGNIKVTVKNCLGSFSSDSVMVTINNPRFDLGADTTSCFNQALQLRPDSNFSNVSYLWSTGATSNFIVADTAQTYALTVTDNFSCTSTDSIAVAIDSSLLGSTLGPDTSLCEGNFIGLQDPDASIISYLWSTGNINPNQLIDTAGIYTVEVNSNRCSISDTIQITIQGLAPTASFNASNFCFQDSVQFLDSSFTAAGDTLASWAWDFDDGQTATQQQPKHYFDNVANFRVSLKVTTDKNCSDTTSQLINIQPKPVANFSIDNLFNCSKEGVQFLNNSNVSSGSITSYFWKFNDSLNSADTAIVDEPIYTFDTLGDYAINLIVTSSEGCSDTIIKNEFINPRPEVRFDFDGSCLNDSTYFTNKTILPQGSIADYLWATNGQVSLKENPVFKYLSGGGKPVALRIRTSAGCQNTFRDTIQLFENPTADFLASLACEGDSFLVADQSSSADQIVNYNYRFNNQSSSSRNPTFDASQVGSFDLQLNVTTSNSCEDSISKVIQVNEAPSAAFTILNNRTGIPFQLALSNNSLRALSYQWDFGNGDFSTAEIPDYTYQDTGSYNLKLVALSSAGCKDSLTKNLIALPRFLDALLERIILEENSNGELGIAAQILNLGNNSINSLKLSVDLNNQYQSKESFDETIFSGNSTILSFSNQFLVDEGEKLDFVCIKIEEVNGVVDDVLINNSACEKGFNNEVVLNAYPNPTAETLFLEYVLPQPGELKINVYDQLGRRVLDEISIQADEGFYQSRLNVINLRPGIYYYNFSLDGEEVNGAFMKR